MFAPAAFRITTRAADADHWRTPLVTTCAVMAMAEVACPMPFQRVNDMRLEAA